MSPALHFATAVASSSLRCLHPRPPIPVKALSRRESAVLLSTLVPFFLQPRNSFAFSLGISGPKEWLKEQKKNSVKFLLAPVHASRDILQSAFASLMQNEANFSDIEMEEFHNKLALASRDCLPENRNSFVTFQANTGVEVCTFRLIVKNASSLLDDKDPMKLQAEEKLNDLLSSFSSLDALARDSGVQLVSNRERFADALRDTISCLSNFEQGIKDCLQV